MSEKARVCVEVIKEDFIKRVDPIPHSDDIQGGFVLTQVIDVEKIIKIHDKVFLLEKKVPFQIVLISFDE